MPEGVSEPGPELAPAPGLHGLMRLGPLCIAFPVGAIREVVPRPPHLVPFPAVRPDVIGAIELRGQLIPVLDLGRLLGAEPDAGFATSPIVVILRFGTLVHGVLASAIEGVSDLAPQDMGALAAAPSGPSRAASPAPAPAFARHTFVTASHVGVVLDPAAIAALPGLALAEDRIVRPARDGAGAEPTLVFSIGSLRCALPAGCVDASLPSQPLLPAPVDDPLWIAMLDHKGAQIPVVDTLALLGQGRGEAGRASGGAVVVRTATERDEAFGETGHQAAGSAARGLVALLIDSVDDIVRLPASAVSALSQPLPDAPFARGLVDLPQGPAMVLDGAALVADPRLRTLGTVEQREGPSPTGITTTSIAPTTTRADGGEAGAVLAGREPFLVFTIGGQPFSTPLAMVDEILPRGALATPLHSASGDLVGILPRRGEAVPIVDLAPGLALPPAPVRDFIIVAHYEHNGAPHRAAFPVEALQSVDRTVAQQMPRSGGARSGAIPGALPYPGAVSFDPLATTIRLSDGRACSVLDLGHFARRAISVPR